MICEPYELISRQVDMIFEPYEFIRGQVNTIREPVNRRGRLERLPGAVSRVSESACRRLHMVRG